jgi:3-deoxy-manno-octulosonate cytidylyltransferase (CMP-KDO synthetase)
MGVYTFIPVRLNSKRFPRKPLYKIFGNPLIYHTYNSINKKVFKNTYITTPDFEIFKYCKFNNIPVILNSNNNIKCGTDRVAEAANYLNLKQNDIVINVQGDLPFINNNDLQSIIDVFKINNDIYWLTILKKLSKNNINNKNIVKAICKKQNNIFLIKKFERTLLNLNDIIFHHIGIYAFRNNFLQQFYKLHQTENEKNYSLEQLRGIDNNYNIYGIFSNFKYNSIDVIDDINLIKNIKIEV